MRLRFLKRGRETCECKQFFARIAATTSNRKKIHSLTHTHTVQPLWSDTSIKTIFEMRF